MISRPQRIAIKKMLINKREIQGKIDDNNKEITHLNNMLKVEPNGVNIKMIKESIRFGERLLSSQKTELLRFTYPEIARKVGVDACNVNYQSLILRKAAL